MRTQSLLLAIALAAHLLTSPASAVDTDGDGLLDLIDVPRFNPDASGRVTFVRPGIQDLDGADKLTNVKYLNLRRNQITSIESGDFDGLANLRWLDLSHNPITSMKSGALSGLTNLQELSLE